jgi:hypothetical protein
MGRTTEVKMAGREMSTSKDLGNDTIFVLKGEDPMLKVLS